MNSNKKFYGVYGLFRNKTTGRLFWKLLFTGHCVGEANQYRHNHFYSLERTFIKRAELHEMKKRLPYEHDITNAWFL